MKLLALSQDCHDSNFSYFDGHTVKYFKSERFEQEKHHSYDNAQQWKSVILEQFGVDFEDLDEIAVVVTPSCSGLPTSEEFFPSINYNEYLNASCPVQRVRHHYAHSLSDWVIAEEIDVSIVIDGLGDEDTTSAVFKNDEMVWSMGKEKNGSIGFSLSDLAVGFGIDVNKDHITQLLDSPGKLMGIQSYGNLDESFYDELIEYEVEDLSDIFDFNKWVQHKGSRLLAEHTTIDWVRTLHEAMGDILVKLFSRHANKNDRISYTGGVAQNVIWNTKLKEHFPNLIIPPHCGDEGLSLGALEFLRKKHNLPKFKLENFPYSQNDTKPKTDVTIKTIKETAKLLAEGKTVGWYQGNGEIGPRALGNRSILMNPNIPNAKEIINRIKHRENYRPFGASILEEYKDEYFDSLPDNPYMLYVGMVKENVGLDCITHVDNTCRAQTVGEEPKHFRMLLEEFYKLTGCPILLNTSLNVAGKPIAGNPNHLTNLCSDQGLDYIVIGNIIKTNG